MNFLQQKEMHTACHDIQQSTLVITSYSTYQNINQMKTEACSKTVLIIKKENKINQSS